ncbi:hypothetical protein GBAR_LOCUS3096, partial [Geodia barretti]
RDSVPQQHLLGLKGNPLRGSQRVIVSSVQTTVMRLTKPMLSYAVPDVRDDTGREPLPGHPQPKRPAQPAPWRDATDCHMS